MALTPQHVRPLAVRLVYCEREENGNLFVMAGFDRVEGSWFYRPLSGGIEFGERGHETVRREFLEELEQ